LTISPLAVAATCQAQEDRTQTCEQVGIDAEQVAVDRDSGLPRELAVKHLFNTMAEQVGQVGMPPNEALRKEAHDLIAKEVAEIYGDLRNLRPDVIKIELESSCLKKGH
jgi:hypothetical protein